MRRTLLLVPLLAAGCYSPSYEVPKDDPSAPTHTPQTGTAAGNPAGTATNAPKGGTVPGPGAHGDGAATGTAAGSAPGIDPPEAPEGVPADGERASPAP